MKLSRLAESEIFDDKVDILMQRLDHVESLQLKLRWIIAYGGKRLSPKAQKIYKKIYNQDYQPKNVRKNYARMGDILTHNNIWRDINESWFLRDLNRILPRSWKTDQDKDGAKLLAIVQQESGPGDDSGLQAALAQIMNRLLRTEVADEVGPLIAKHILSEVFA